MEDDKLFASMAEGVEAEFSEPHLYLNESDLTELQAFSLVLDLPSDCYDKVKHSFEDLSKEQQALAMLLARNIAITSMNKRFLGRLQKDVTSISQDTIDRYGRHIVGSIIKTVRSAVERNG